MITIVSALEALCDMLRAKIGGEVIIGRPDDAVAGIYVWPWKLDENRSFRNLRPDIIDPATKSSHQTFSLNIYFLMLVRPALTSDGLSRLGDIHQAMFNNPILSVDGTSVALIHYELSTDQLASIFSAASIPLTVCLSAKLQFTQQY
jgi:hypothetical protein